MLKLQRFYFRSAWSLPLIALLGTSPKLFADSFPTREIMLQEFATRFKATSVTEFFRKRDTDTGLDNCRKDLKAYSDAYIKARDKSQYAKMEDIMKRGPNPGPLGTTTRGLVDLMQQCGPCVTDVFHVGTIYNSDGWCRFPQVEAAKLSQSMAQIRALLTNAESYPAHRQLGEPP